jgi:hypothetical protein
MDATWDDSGTITAGHSVMALPAVSYEPNPRNWVVSRMAPDIALLALVAFYLFIAAMDVYYSLTMQVC